MFLNPGKCCYMTFGSKFSNNNDLLLEDDTTIPSAEEHVVLGITIDSHLNFYSHLKQLCKKVANKLNALTRIALHLDQDPKKLVYNSFFYWATKLLSINMDILLEEIESPHKQTSRTRPQNNV